MNELFTQLMEYMPVILAVIGFCAFLVSAVVQVTKELPVIVKIPTKAWTMVVSIALCTVAYFAYIAYVNAVFMWYYLIAVFIEGLLVSYVATYGWDSFNELYDRFKRKGKGTVRDERKDR